MLNKTLAPSLAQLPKPQSVSFSGNGTYIDSVRVLSETPLNTSSGADETDTFYVCQEFDHSIWRADDRSHDLGIYQLPRTTYGIRLIHRELYSCLLLLNLNSNCIRRVGLLKLNSMAALIPSSTPFLLIRPHSLNVIHSSRSNSMPHPPSLNLPIPALASLS